MTLSIAISKMRHSVNRHLIKSFVRVGVADSPYAECHYAERCYAECCGAQCSIADIVTLSV